MKIIKVNKNLLTIKDNKDHQVNLTSQLNKLSQKEISTINKSQLESKEHNFVKLDETKSNLKNNKKSIIFVHKIIKITKRKTIQKKIALKKELDHLHFLNNKHILHGKLNNNSSNKYLLNLFKERKSFYDNALKFITKI